ncbi:MAG: cytochrome c oxidase assembly protein [Verrucomicrobia bacterium]|nr:cytochrome c oxidase assembly protein [Verrucomicrobiota bacterium]
MDVTDAVLGSWSFRLVPVLMLAVTAAVYLRGWLALRRVVPRRFEPWRLVCFGAGLLTIFVAVCSPLDAFGNLLLEVHMVQHLLLMMVAPALVQLGCPYLPLLSGMPRWLARDIAGPVLTLGWVKRTGHWLTHPAVCWLAYVSATVLWHVPPFYELTLHSSGWHEFEHACFLISGLLFWYPVVQPWPSRPHWPRWAVIPYLLLADFQNTVLSAFLSFYDQVLYPTYQQVPRLGTITPVADQNIAGAIMWVPGSLAFLIPAGIIAWQFLSPPRSRMTRPAPGGGRTPSPLPAGTVRKLAGSRRTDLLRIPVAGPALRSAWFRRTVQAGMFGLAVAVVIDGFWGPQVGPMNLAGVLPWVHWRGLTVIGLLVVGNAFCYACPFTFLRDLGRKLLPADRNWPRWLRSKWLAVVLVAVYLWAYEAFSLWNSPWLTAWIIVGYFVAAFVIDGFFRGATFCKYVCPIGQFHFFQSWFSPFEVRVRTADVCRTCRSYDCIRGNETQRGCELRLFQPRKQGNQDCTFCLDCVRACPQGNVGLIAVKPAAALGLDPFTSGVGKVSQRPDLLALVLLLTFGAYANAAGMVAPVAGFLEWFRLSFGLLPYPAVIALFYGISVFVVPALLLGVCAWANQVLGGCRLGKRELVSQFLIDLAPLGAAVWIGHFGFHLLAASHAPVPIVQRILTDLHWLPGGMPLWHPRSWAFPEWLDIEILLLDLGLLLSLLGVWRTARRLRPGSSTLRLAWPWALATLVLFVIGVWLIFQPMQMRGTMMTQ